ncbi:hypothetical protein SPBR_03856 [Sporothrix brasiliensis 5110]|uniref:Uncharacterized protein n=1 Tax=Sporothrix brasiliensis 5110 TaxID=1398154 RepID=A0A0C2FV57_9PEZI|nr:uncharacterized protein SPBR_03856 [Sporothrix brasiliensis 5110]KIH94933.1 hypothetical protein SPBR_03856 [Sporothrix brasiliensis 5110]
MSSFPKLIPAFTARIPIRAADAVGSSKGGLNLVRFVSVDEGHGGSLVSEPGYPVAVDAQFVHGADYIRPEDDGKRLRLNVNSVLKQKGSDDALLNYTYTGLIEITDEIAKVLSGAPGAASTPQGQVFTQVNFESGHPSLKVLGTKLYVAAGRFIVEAGQPVIVEYKISEVSV